MKSRYEHGLDLERHDVEPDSELHREALAGFAARWLEIEAIKKWAARKGVVLLGDFYIERRVDGGFQIVTYDRQQQAEPLGKRRN